MSDAAPAADSDPHPALLTPETAGRHGVDGSWRVGIEASVRWSEVDAFGHANHRAFLEWYENARNRYLVAAGLPRLTYTTPGPVLGRVEARYLKPLRFADTLLVTARVRSIRRTSFTMDYAVWRDGCCATGSALCVLMIAASGEKVPVPDGVRARMIAFDDPEILT